MLMDLESGESETWLSTPFQDDAPNVSPDGCWIAFASDSSGLGEVFVAPLSGERTRMQVSVDGGSEPLWIGDTIYYRDDEITYAVSVRTEPELELGRPEELFRLDDGVPPVGPFANYTVAPDGRFLMIEGGSDPGYLVVATSWVPELERSLR